MKHLTNTGAADWNMAEIFKLFDGYPWNKFSEQIFQPH